MTRMSPQAKRFKFGWYGDGGHGEREIKKILAGTKTATICLAYEPEDADVKAGDTLELVDKAGKVYGIIVVNRIEKLLWGAVTEPLAQACGHTLKDLQEMSRFANARDLKPDEEMRVTHFELAQMKKVKL